MDADVLVEVLLKEEAVLRKEEEMEDAVLRRDDVRLTFSGGWLKESSDMGRLRVLLFRVLCKRKKQNKHLISILSRLLNSKNAKCSTCTDHHHSLFLFKIF